MQVQDLNDDKIQLLQDYLKRFENSHDYPASHGYICAMIVLPTPYGALDLLGGLLDEEPAFNSDTEQEEVTALIHQLKTYIDGSLSSGDAIMLPVGAYIQEKAISPDLESWCIGFMDAVFAHEDDWYADQDELVTELLLPMACISDIFNDKELRQLVSAPKKAKQMCEQIPHILVDLYLLFRQN